MNKSDSFSHRFEPWRLWIVYLLLMVVFGYFIIKLFDYQVVQGSDFFALAEENRMTNISIQSQRGLIYDRNDYVLARNVPSFNVVITPALLPADEGAIQKIYRELSELIGLPVNRGTTDDATVKAFKPCDNDLGITQIVYIGDTNAPYDPVRILCNVDRETALIVKEKASDWPGVGIEVEPIRDYPTGEITSEVIGFLGPIPASQEDYYSNLGFVPGRDKVGYAGIEASENGILAGKNGLRTVEVDVAGKELRDLVAPVQAVPGNNIRLTIDTRLQNAAKAALKEEIRWWNTYLNRTLSNSGVVIAMNPKTGEILSLVSYPTFENNRMARVIPSYYYEQLSRDPTRPLFNHAISAEFPPGSVFKLTTAVGALNEGVVTPEQEIFDPGKITITQKYSPNDPGSQQDYVCWDEAGHGNVDFLHGVAWSCDIYFNKIAGGFPGEVENGLNIWRLGEYARALGYGQTSGIELPGEAEGLVPDPDWKRINMGENWATGDTYIAAMGQGYVLSTVLQVLESAAIVANDGKHMKPTLIKDILDSEGNVIQPFTPQMLWDMTTDPVISVYDENNYKTEEKKVVQKWVIDLLKEGMHMVTLDGGTAYSAFKDMSIQTSGKTGTAEYCDDVASAKDICKPGNWPTHSWYVGYAPFDNPEIAVVAFVYNGGEGASVAAPIVRRVMEAYFELKAIDSSSSVEP